jgi:hypothetical protein
MTPPPAAAAAARPVAGTAAPPLRRPFAPRRVSGPARQPRAVPHVPEAAPLLGRIVDHPLLDRLIRGRAWIGIVAFALISIVAMQVALLHLNTGIGAQLQRSALLQRENTLLAAQVSALGAAERVQGEATQLGMVYAPPGDVRYVTAGRGDAARAARAIVPPLRQAADGASSTQPSMTTSSTPPVLRRTLSAPVAPLVHHTTPTPSSPVLRRTTTPLRAIAPRHVVTPSRAPTTTVGGGTPARAGR